MANSMSIKYSGKFALHQLALVLARGKQGNPAVNGHQKGVRFSRINVSELIKGQFMGQHIVAAMNS